MSVVETALRRPYTVAALLILIILMGVGTLMGVGAALRMPIDIFPEIDIPVVAVVWTYNGMSAQDIQNRILTLHTSGSLPPSWTTSRGLRPPVTKASGWKGLLARRRRRDAPSRSSPAARW